MSADPRDRCVVLQAASVLLEYPDAELLDRLPSVSAALNSLDASAYRQRAGRLFDLVRHLRDGRLPDLQRHYVEVFDLTSKRCLYLSYYTDGDTRRRGAVLGSFKAHYRASGYLVDTHGELPDYLPLVLEYAALVDPADGMRLLTEYRPSIELLRLALRELGTAYEVALAAVCATLPGASPKDTAEVMRMVASGPPREEVGLEPYTRAPVTVGGAR